MSRSSKHPAPDAATHVIAEPTDRHSLCGVKDPLPVVCAPFVQRHVDGHGLVVCDGCAAQLVTP